VAFTERSVNLILLVQVPSLVVLRPVVVLIGPIGVSLAETVTVRDAVQPLSSQSSSGIEVGPNDAARVLEILNDGAGAQPLSSDTNVLPVYVRKSIQAVPPDGSRNAETFVSVQTLPTQLLDELCSWFSPPVVSAATGTTDAAISRTTPANTLATLFMSSDLIYVAPGGQRPSREADNVDVWRHWRVFGGARRFGQDRAVWRSLPRDVGTGRYRNRWFRQAATITNDD
jgi:hypothetical protein